MRTTDNPGGTHSKQRLRVEINNHIEDFLHRGGKIQVLAELPGAGQFSQGGHWPAAGEVAAFFSPQAE
jgi:hypothetical protein